MSETHTIVGSLTATIAAQGAELVALDDPAGHKLLWDAGPLWPSHSPVLFPIVGQLAGDQFRFGGRTFAMGRHGLARRRRFTWVDRDAHSCRLQLAADAETMAAFPFPFRLQLEYRLQGDALRVVYTLENSGGSVLPASLGAHPAFRWPLHSGAQTDYRLQFAAAEPAPIHRLAAGLLDPAPHPTPVEGHTLHLDPKLFEADAMVMLEPRSRSLRYLGPGGGLEFSWDGFPHLGLWQKPGAEFICIEPWHGYSSPADWDGEFPAKPGLLLIPPGETRTFSWTVRSLAAERDPAS